MNRTVAAAILIVAEITSSIASAATPVRPDSPPSQAQWPLPYGTPLPPPIAAPRDDPFPGIIQLQVDATDVAHRIYRVHEVIPVDGASPLTLLFPQWLPGDHAPTGGIDQLAGLVVTAAGKALKWRRDTVEICAFHVDVPAGARTVDVNYEFLVPADQKIGPILMSPTMMDLQWQSVLLYPAGYYARGITYDASVILPAGWTFASALEGAHRSGDVVTFGPASVEGLVDSPVMAGRWMKRVSLSEDPVPVFLDIAADREADLALPAGLIDGYRREVAQAYKLFGAHHYNHYDMLMWVSDDFGPAYYEAHRAGENVVPANFFRENGGFTRSAGFPFHAYIHSWNGLFRSPAEMWQPNFNVADRPTLLWVVEGLTVYWNHVLDARSGLASKKDVIASLQSVSAGLMTRAGRQWRPLEDASNEEVIQHGNGAIFPTGRSKTWPSWQLDVGDVYDQGELIWLDVDTLIRQQTHGRQSLDDFAREFFGVRDGSWETDTYTFDDLVEGLDAVMPYDWATFLRHRVASVGSVPLVDGLNRAGYEFALSDLQSDVARQSEMRRGGVDLRYSVGMTLDKEGDVTDMVWDSPAFVAGIAPGSKILAINGHPFGSDAMRAAVAATKDGTPLSLRVRRGTTEVDLPVAWNGGLLYPEVRRIPGSPDMLDEILKPRT